MLFRFRDFPVYKKSKEFRALSHRLVKTFPESERFVLTNQIRRATDSICLNIAEGSNRMSDRDKAHFLNQALTSLEEVIAGFDLALDEGHITKQDMDDLVKIGEGVGKQLIGFSKKLRST